MTYLILFLSGVATALPFLFPILWPITWISLAPLFYLAPQIKKRYLHGLCFGMGFYLPLYYWFIQLYPMDFAGFTPLMGGITVAVCWIGLSLLQASEMAFIPMIYGLLVGRGERARRYRALHPFLAAACFTVFEWFQSLFWHGVPWGRLALSQTGFLPMVQSASLLGSLFICFLLALCGGAIAVWGKELWALIRFGNKHSRITASLALLAILAVPTVNGIWGGLRLARIEGDLTGEREIKIALIQGNIASGDKWNGSLSDTVDKYLNLSREAVEEQGAELVLWPETVVTLVLSDAPHYRWMLGDFAARYGVTLVVGSYALNAEGNRTNALYCFLPDGTLSETVYAKRHLVPFGEYLPVPEVFGKIPFLAGMNLSESALTPGTEPALFDTEWGKLGGLVCFDSIYDTLCRDSVVAGADLILLSTNDSWYRDSRAIYQHNAHAQLRAIENGRSIARAANTGTSTLILPSGRVTDSLPPMVTGTVVGTLPLHDETTVYQRVGNLIVPLSLALLAAGGALGIADRIGKRKREA